MGRTRSARALLNSVRDITISLSMPLVDKGASQFLSVDRQIVLTGCSQPVHGSHMTSRKEYFARRFQERKAKGLCRCGKKAVPGLTRCKQCRLEQHLRDVTHAPSNPTLH